MSAALALQPQSLNPTREELEERFGGIFDDEVEHDEASIERLANMWAHDDELDRLEQVVRGPHGHPVPLCGDQAWEWADPMSLAFKTLRRFGTAT